MKSANQWEPQPQTFGLLCERLTNAMVGIAAPVPGMATKNLTLTCGI